MFLSPLKKSILFLSLLLFFIQLRPLFSQEKAATFFGPYYRTNQYLPIVVNQQDDFDSISIENKYSSDSLIFNQDKKAEALVKVFSDGTLFELKDKKNEKKILNLSFRILPEETPLIVIACDQNQTIEDSKKRIKTTETKILPSYSSSYEMVDVLVIKESYQDNLTTQQTEAIKDWVLSGGIIIFESKLVLKKHGGLAVPLLKQTNHKLYSSSNKSNMIEELNNEATRISQQPNISSTGYGYIGIKAFNLDGDAEELVNYCNGQIEWRTRNRNNALAETNSLKHEVSSVKILLIQKISLIYFLFFMIFAFLKITNYFARLTCLIATLSIIPLVFLTPMKHLDSHYYQLLGKKEQSDLALIKEELYLRKGNIPEISIAIDNAKPFFVNDSSKIILQKTPQGQYVSQLIQSTLEYISIKRTSLSKDSAFQKFQKEKGTYFYHKFPLEKIYEVSEANVKPFQFNIETSNKDGVISKINTPLASDNRDGYEKKTWYAFTNQIFYSKDKKPDSIIILEGTSKLIPLDISPNLTIQRSFFSFLDIPE